MNKNLHIKKKRILTAGTHNVKFTNKEGEIWNT